MLAGHVARVNVHGDLGSDPRGFHSSNTDQFEVF